MSDWLDQYSAALDERDAREQAHKPYIDAFTKLADRTASSSSSNQAATASSPSLQTQTQTKPSTASRGKTHPPSPSQTPADLILSLRNDLSNTQKARSALQSQVEDLTSCLQTLELQHKGSTAQITQLTRQKVEAERRLRDREEEIRGKARLVTEAQDEMVALGLQLNMAEQKAEKLQEDNKELLDRWMRAKREEADRMNRDSKWE